MPWLNAPSNRSAFSTTSANATPLAGVVPALLHDEYSESRAKALEPLGQAQVALVPIATQPLTPTLLPGVPGRGEIDSFATTYLPGKQQHHDCT